MKVNLDSNQGLTSKRPKKLIFKGKSYTVEHWTDLYVKLLGIIKNERSDFDRVLTLKGRTRRARTYFSKDNTILKDPYLIEGTDIYAETNFSSDNMMKRIRGVINLFDLPEDDFSYELK